VGGFGINALVLPPRYEAPAHLHEHQEEVYFVHRGEVEIEFGDGSRHLLGAGAAARVDPATVRQLRNLSSQEAVLVIVGAAEGYVGRDGKPPAEGARPGGPL
jgi:mannose-6-phosphate isomerase-like protein (cupin superfamily)